ncbi:hypothetical protein BgAZ_502100 [Babesia gibsoni]|uniref:Uncharacterized protein n=1 Tax=Babesia gibsoni TaxID=33632 RepID=A0AAD8LLZ4_BABGI|nr:hypothetical protein BgAZ_502100 [Babesia gibsoni]
MEFSVMAASFLQPNMLLCGSVEGDMCVVDTYRRMKYRNNAEDAFSSREEDAEEPSDLGTSTWKQSKEELEDLILEKYPKLFRYGIVCIEYHPRLPSLIAVGLTDGTVHLLFLEGENLKLKKTISVFKFNDAINQITWLLVDAVKDTQNNYKLHSTALIDRIWKTLSKSSYHSVLVARSGEDVRFTVVEPKFVIRSVFTNEPVTSNKKQSITRSNGAEEGIPENAPSDDKDGLCNSNDEAAKCNNEENSVWLMFNMKWPLPEYFEKELEYNTLTNFCRVKESLCIMRHIAGQAYMDVYIPEDFEDDVVFSKFTTRMVFHVEGSPTFVDISPKQYNQTDRYLGTNNKYLFNIKGEKCINSIGEFIAIGTDKGHLYATSMLHIYNSAYFNIVPLTKSSHTDESVANGVSLQSNIGSADEGDTGSVGPEGSHNDDDECETSEGVETENADNTDHADDEGRSNCSGSSSMQCSNVDDNSIVAELEMSSYFIGSPILKVKWATIWNDITRDPFYISPSHCCCTDDITFLLSVVTTHFVTLMRLCKEDGVLSICSCKKLDTQCSCIQWIERTIPNDMALWMWTHDGMQGLECHHSTVALSN